MFKHIALLNPADVLRKGHRYVVMVTKRKSSSMGRLLKHNRLNLQSLIRQNRLYLSYFEILRQLHKSDDREWFLNYCNANDLVDEKTSKGCY